MKNRAAGVIIAGFFTVYIAFAIRYAYGLILPYMLPALAISKTEAGIIFSSYFITYTLFAPIFGMLVDRSDAKIILTIFVFILAIGTCLISLSSSVFQACIFFGLTGIGHSACWATVVTVVMRWTSEKKRGITLSIVDLGTTTGIAMWSIIIPFIIRSSGWRTVWFTLGITAFLVAGMNYFLVKNRPPEQQGTKEAETVLKTHTAIKEAYKAIFRDSKFYLVGFSYLLISFSILIPFTYLITFATQGLMISYTSAAGLVVAIAVSGAVGKLILGYISDIAGRIKIMMLCGVLTASGSLGMAFSHVYPMLLFFSILFGIGYGTLWSVYAASARDLFSREYSGSIIGLWTLFHGLGSVLSPVLSGMTIDLTGNFVWAFILAVISSVISLLLLLPLVKTDSARR